MIELGLLVIIRSMQVWEFSFAKCVGSSIICDRLSKVISSASFSPAKFSVDSPLQMSGDLAFISPVRMIKAGFSFLI